MPIDFSQVEQLAVEFDGVPARLELMCRTVVRRTGQATVARAQKNLIAADAVDTGNLMGSVGVDVDPDGLGFTAGPTADYGHYVEDGTSRMPGRPYMAPAFDTELDKAIAAIEALAAKALR